MNWTEHGLESVQGGVKGARNEERRRYGTEEIITELPEAGVDFAQGGTVSQVVRMLGVSKQTASRCAG